MYELVLTEEDVATIAFVGNRYEWSVSLGKLNEGVNNLTESQAWEIREAICGEDGEDWDLTLLDPRCDLYDKIEDLVLNKII
tara:strand:- start:102 stop:347 length:246 start_codon:yes stop_codon:yes gene_type:complete